MVYEIEGRRFHTLEEFFDEISAVLIPGSEWGRNLDAFNDILRGRFWHRTAASPSAGRITRCPRSVSAITKRSGSSRRRLQRCHPSNLQAVSAELAAARAGHGPTVFDGW